MLELERLKRAQEKKKKADQRLARAQRESNAAEKDEKALARRVDHKRKVVLGGIILKAVREDVISREFVRDLIGQLASDRDKKAFDGTEFAALETEGSGVPVRPAEVTDLTADMLPPDRRE